MLIILTDQFCLLASHTVGQTQTTKLPSESSNSIKKYETVFCIHFSPVGNTTDLKATPKITADNVVSWIVGQSSCVNTELS